MSTSSGALTYLFILLLTSDMANGLRLARFKKIPLGWKIIGEGSYARIVLRRMV